MTEHKWDFTAVEKVADKPRTPVAYIMEQQKLRSRNDLLKLRIAVDCAENIFNFDRELLHNIYRDIIEDPTLTSNWESRKMETTQRIFKVVSPSGEEVPEKTKVLQSDWFYLFLDAALDAKAWGFTLMEFGPLVNGEFLPYEHNGKYYPAVNCIIRDNVKPEFGIITPTPTGNKGVSWLDPEFTESLMFIGSYTDHGWLKKAAKYILFKNNALGNWSEWAEVFGMDKRVGYTDAQGDDRKKFLLAVRDIGTNAYGVFTSRDKIEYIGSGRIDAYAVYERLIQMIDSQMSKLIFGQDVVQNNTGNVVGKVGEGVANKYGKADALYASSIVNTRLFPMMERLGYSWGNLSFMWDTTEKVSLVDRSVIDLNIAKMGKAHDDGYINKTYGVQVTEKVEKPLNKPKDEQI